MTVSRFRIGGMDCAAEEQLIRMRLAQLDGIDHVGVDLTTREVTVEHSSDTAAVTAALDTLDLDASHLGDGGTITNGDATASGYWGSNNGDDGYVTGSSTASASALVDTAAFNQTFVQGANVMSNSVDTTVVGGHLTSSLVGDDDLA